MDVESASGSDTRRKGVSVILPTIRIDPWLDMAIGSLLLQEGIEFEVLVVHDGIIADRGRPWVKDSRVRIIEIEARSGVANALNVGALNSQFAYLARLDADDTCLPDRLRVQFDYLLKHPSVAIVGTRAKRVDEHGNVTGSLGERDSGDLRNKLLSKNCLIHSSVMYRFDQFKIAGRYDASLRQMEDYDLWLRMALIGEVRIMDSEYVQYRVHANQWSHEARPVGNYITQILRNRSTLRRVLGTSRARQLASNLIWLTAQVVRYLGLRTPGYAR